MVQVLSPAEMGVDWTRAPCRGRGFGQPLQICRAQQLRHRPVYLPFASQHQEEEFGIVPRCVEAAAVGLAVTFSVSKPSPLIVHDANNLEQVLGTVLRVVHACRGLENTFGESGVRKRIQEV